MNEELLRRTKELGIKIVYLVDELPNNPSGWAIVKQIARSAASIGANFSSVCLAKSKADFINKLKILQEECDETIFWLEVIEEAGILTMDRFRSLKSESMELFAIFVSSLRTGKIISMPKIDYKHSI
ncbi:MAG: four helix bundle protein [Saprospiraceae bacterium]